MRGLVIALTGFAALSAIGGGAEMLIWQRGNPYLDTGLLEHMPFSTFLVPGILLAAVVGGTNALAMALAWRRSRFAIDATILAGGALTVWMLVELALMRTVHWLHLVYGSLGLSIAIVAVVGALRSAQPRYGWTVKVTFAEALGFMFPMSVGIAASHAGVSDGTVAAMVVVAGFVEGLALGAGQAAAFPLRIHRARYAVLSGFGGMLAWASAMGIVALASQDVHPAVVGIAAVLGGGIGLVSIGGAQWLELRGRARHATRWIAWTALAWIVALPISFTVGPFIDERTPIGYVLALYAASGMVMAYAMAVVTWAGAARLSDRSGVARGHALAA
ncbi:MAG: hypothetical protein AB7S26_12640 [Sandaracinaceae bacterium]